MPQLERGGRGAREKLTADLYLGIQAKNWYLSKELANKFDNELNSRVSCAFRFLNSIS